MPMQPTNAQSNLSVQMQQLSLDCEDFSNIQHPQDYNLDNDDARIVYTSTACRSTGPPPSIERRGSLTSVLQVPSDTYKCYKEYTNDVPALSAMSVSYWEQTYEEDTWRLYERIQRSRGVSLRKLQPYSKESLHNSLCTVLNEVNNDDEYFFLDISEEEDRSSCDDEDSKSLQVVTEDDAIFEIDM